MGNDATWKEIKPGAITTLGVKRDGTLWGWGNNEMGHFGSPTPTVSHVPVQLGTDRTWETVSIGAYHTLAIKTDGSLWAWGWNSVGQVGNGSTLEGTVEFTRIGTDNDWREVAAGNSHSLALKKNGTAYGWGDNRLGQVGAGDETFQVVPLEISGSTPWLSVGSSYDSRNSGGLRE